MTADRYKTHGGAETRYQPGSNDEVLENLLGITGKTQMDQIEYEQLIAVQNYYAEHVLSEDTGLTAALICTMHRDWLGDIYEWAGNYRTVNVAKGNFQWGPSGFVDGSMRELEVGLLNQCTPCRAKDIESLAKQLSEVHAELLAIHPFRDGNGRIARWLADIMAIQAGFSLPDYDFGDLEASEKKDKYIIAVAAGYRKDYELLTTFFVAALERGMKLG